jgi:hypothetical protein
MHGDIMAEILDPIEGAAAAAQPEQKALTLDDMVDAEGEGQQLQDVSEQPSSPEAPVETIELPDKYRGKSISEIVQMHQEAESVIGKQGAEVGQLRGIVDGFIKQNPAQQPAQPQVQEEKVDFFDNPEAAVEAAIANNPRVQAAEAAARRMEQATAIADLQRKHPDIKDVLSDGEFVRWVQESPVRTQLFRDAEVNFNSAAADELLSTFKQVKQLANRTVEVEKVAQEQAKQAAATGVVESSGETSKKFYRRSDIINLRINDPERYEQLQPEIMQAYAEKRVIT